MGTLTARRIIEIGESMNNGKKRATIKNFLMVTINKLSLVSLVLYYGYYG
jgi:hypothetical protein